MTPTALEELKPLPAVRALGIGMFDGVHVGHQAIVQSVLEQAGSPEAAALLTFEPHPLMVIDPARAPERLTTPEEKAELLEAAGIGQIIVLRFDAHVRVLTPEEFFATLLRIFPALRSITVGERWAFGRGRAGTTETLKALTAQHGLVVEIVRSVAREGEIVSSSRIRRAVREGDFALAQKLLGRSYGVEATVVPGHHRGRELGFPTANLEHTEQLLPPAGVYATHAHVGGQTWPAMANLGRRPTFETEGALTLEAHLIGYEGESLTGKVLLLDNWHWLRAETKFADADALHLQLERDRARALKVLAASPPPNNAGKT